MYAVARALRPLNSDEYIALNKRNKYCGLLASEVTLQKEVTPHN